jgi:hypothetical protein
MTPDLSTPTRLGILEGEAGNRAQSDTRCGVTLALMGSSHGETEPEKMSHFSTGAQQNLLIALELTPPHPG